VLYLPKLKATFNAGATKEEIAELLGVVLLTSGAPAAASCRDIIGEMIKDL